MIRRIFRALLGGSVLALVFAASCTSRGPLPGAERGDVALLEASAAAQSAYERGDVLRAASLYQQALERARAMNSAPALVDAACNLAVCHISLKHYQAADVLLLEADYDARRGSLGRSDVLLLRAKVAYLQGRFAESASLADNALRTGADETSRIGALIVTGLAQCGMADAAAAKAQLQAIEKVARARGPLSPSLRADVAKLRGTIARIENRTDEAGRLFDEEAALLQTARRYSDMSHALARAAECHLEAGEPGLAADRFFLAGRSIAALGDPAAARSLLESSISAAEKANDPSARARAAALMKEITDAGP